MKETDNEVLNLKSFYPDELKIKQVSDCDNEVLIDAEIESKSCQCPKCKTISTHKHGTYFRKVQDLPILGKTTWLQIHAYDYQCDNPECEVRTFAEDLNGFLRQYSRSTDRLEQFLCILALDTSCEASARISKNLGIKTSGDTVIRMLEREYEEQPSAECGSYVGIDDFAFKKGCNYGTIVVDGETHKPVAMLDGRDGNELRDWLKKNKQVKTITRDRASAYTKAISEVLPDCMQIADRFHLYQNLSEAIKKALQSEMPKQVKISITKDEQTDEEQGTLNPPSSEAEGKKNRISCE